MKQVVATAGHVDHGKSTLVRALTGIEPDRWAEERRRGMTIDLGFAWTTLPDGSELSFVDVPGHERFVPNMLAGVGPVPAVMFVVAADDGWRPQSAEHLGAIDAMGVRRGLLVVTRSDLSDPHAATLEAQDHLRHSTLAGIESVAVSAVTGEGMDELRAALGRLARSLPDADTGARVRLWVDRVFTIKGAGTVVTGTLGDGRLAVGDELEVATTGRGVRVRGLQSQGRQAREVTGVARVAVNLRGAGPEDVRRGDALVRPGQWLVTDVADVRLAGRRETNETAHLMLHVGSAAEPVRLRRFPDGDGDAPGTGRVRLARALPLSIGDRGLLRDPSRHDLVVGFEVLDPLPPALARRGAAAERADVLGAVGTPTAAAEVRRRGFVSGAVLSRLGVDPSSLRPLTGEWYVDEELADGLQHDLEAYVDAYLARHPLEPGVPLGEVRAKLGLPDVALVRALLRPPLEVAAGRVVRTGQPGQTGTGPADLPPGLAEGLAAVRSDLAAEPFQAPDADRLRSLGLGPRELAAAERVGGLLRVADGIVLLPDAADRALERLTELAQPFTVSEARLALATTRRVALPLLGLLDRTGRTRLLPDGTRLVVDAGT